VALALALAGAGFRWPKIDDDGKLKSDDRDTENSTSRDAGLICEVETSEALGGQVKYLNGIMLGLARFGLSGIIAWAYIEE